jgi:preprotein translocase subunit SecY
MSNLGLGRRIGLTIGALLVMRLGTYIPVPGINPAVWEPLFRQHSGGILGAFDALAGGAVGRLSVFALSIVPFVTASLLLQLASIVFPALRALPRRGDSGRRRLDAYTLVLAIGLAFFQAVAIALALEGLANVVAAPGMTFRVTTALTLTGGVIVQVCLARLITARGIGNGFALILATGIVAALPAAIAGGFELSRQGVLSTDVLLGCGLLAIALTALVVHVELARRKLEATFAREAGARTIEGRAQLQFKLNSAGMVPAILVSWLLLPILAIDISLPLPDWVMSHLGHGRPVFMILYGLAIVLCAFFYTAFLLSPDELAEDLQKHGGVIVGVEPGDATADHIDRVVSRINVIGAVYLAFMLLIPEILIAKWSLPFYLGGPSLLIVVCAILDLKRQFAGARRKRLEAT